jgi:hypothetical protein
MPRTKKASSKVDKTSRSTLGTRFVHQREEPAENEIARRAYEIYCGRGYQHGHDLDDWLQAKHELKAAGPAAA